MAVAGSQLPQVRRGLALINNPVWSRPSLDPCVVERSSTYYVQCIVHYTSTLQLSLGREVLEEGGPGYLLWLARLALKPAPREFWMGRGPPALVGPSVLV
ncbi:predicted protein [Histoplasma capsulatum G186AR]|uniref:Uncharacterized protein n=1 Tax=Ajellomyces capsulatus (strain G186AR / H82 / ATCC MYA-2454 / RMSCC 2432) TaxID=447093 RepID=C0NQR0_AJECG|nr:uncharacterized protein HCBG_05340 [Histoplasma capsulatum G186AR]EEH06024.1 predicted protein [Histoplasma capsulatum G186AR]